MPSGMLWMGDGRGDGYAEGHVVHRRSEGGDAFGEVVDADGQRRHHAHAHQTGIVRLMVHLLDSVCFVGVLDRGDQPVDDADQQNAREETRHGDDHARVCAPFGREGRVCLLEQLDERDVDHHAAREAQRERKQPFVGAFGEEGDRAADAVARPAPSVSSRGMRILCSSIRIVFVCLANTQQTVRVAGFSTAKIMHKTKYRTRKDSVFSR